MIFGNCSKFAVEFQLAEVYEKNSQRGLGCFLIYVNGRVYGVNAPDATLLACSYDGVANRISNRGRHVVPFVRERDPKDIVFAYLASRFDVGVSRRCFCGLSASEFEEFLTARGIVWAPDGDQAFDDGSHVLQFDDGNQVRLIAFLNDGGLDDISKTISDVWMPSDEFYGILSSWKLAFDRERDGTLIKRMRP
ncbi:Imm42 family immunity protein [Niveibacterium terrae]|uniref:Imm42 family immunity protein n=1 Tax=Niveibacterium terrae TaxID=3373598 RepID=UPI003A8FF634